MTVLNKTFFEDIRPQATGGPEYKTIIKRLRGGGEKRNELWRDPLRTYNVSLGARDTDRISELYDFVADTAGSANSFRLKDWSDFKSCRPQQDVTAADQEIGVGDGTTYYFSLSKLYGETYRRPILKPRVGTVVFAKNGVQVSDTEGFVDHENGTVVFDTPPSSGDIVTAGFEFDVPVRFSEDITEVMMLFHRTGASTGIGIQEVRVRQSIDTDSYADLLLALSNKSFTAPAAFPWNDTDYAFTATRDMGLYSVNLQPRDLVDAAIWTGTEVYVDGRAGFGDDSNTGADYDNALRTIHAAFTVGNATGAPYQVVVRSGDFSESAFTQNGNVEPSQPVAIIADGGRVRYRTGEWEQTWTLDQGTTYTTPASSPKRLFRTDLLTENGNYTELVGAVDVAAVRTTVGTWVEDGGSIYVNIGGLPAAEDVAVMRGFHGARFMTHTDDFYIEGFDIEGGITGALHLDPIASRNVVGSDCTFKYSSPGNVNNGLDACRVRRTNGLVAFFDCDASSGAKDGFNFHDDGTLQMYVLMVNCNGFDNGDGVQTSVNGFTTHENVISAVIGGSFGNSREGTEVHVIDNTRTWMVGTTAKARDIDDDSTCFKCSATSITWLEETSADAQGSVDNYSIFANGGTAYTRNHVTIAGTLHTTNDGIITGF